jgi:uncharacterized protein (UPF0261 family)
MLFSTIERMVVQTARRKLIKLPFHINDRPFAEALVKNFREIAETAQTESERHAWRA